MNSYLLGGVALVVLGGSYAIYVSLVKKKNNVKEATASVDVQLKKRYDLIPNLLKSASRFMEHEKDIFISVTTLREQAMNTPDVNEKFKLEQKLSIALRDFKLTAENYPELKSDVAIANAMQGMGEVEEHISASRRFYNSAVKDYKNALEIFPSSLIAKFMGLKDCYPFFEVAEEERASIDVDEFLN